MHRRRELPRCFDSEAGRLRISQADGHGTPELLNAILEVFPLDSYTDTPAMLMQKMDCDKELDIPIWDKYVESVAPP